MSASELEKTVGELDAYLGRRAGRKRKVEVTLPVLTSVSQPYVADDPNDTKPVSRLPSGGKRGYTYRDIDDSTVAQSAPTETYENIVQLTEIFEKSFVGLGQAQDRKVTIRQQADPLGIKSGSYKKRPKFTIGDATPERFTKAKDGGKRLQKEKETFEDGRETGLARKRFVSLLETWHKRGTIDKATFSAAETFQRDCDLALEASPRMISRYGHILPAGVPELLPQEVQVEFERRKKDAIKAVGDPRLHFILGWIAESSNSDVHPDEIAERYWPHLSQDRRMERFKALFEYVCMRLSVHYGQADDKVHRWVRLAISKAAQEVHDLLYA